MHFRFLKQQTNKQKQNKAKKKNWVKVAVSATKIKKKIYKLY